MRYRPRSLYFDFTLEREEQDLEVEVTYTVDDEDLCIESVKHEGREIDITDAEDKLLLDHASDRAYEDMADADASYGDFLCDLERDEY
jgi:hypothetical protein